MDCIHERVLVGSESACRTGGDGFWVVHAMIFLAKLVGLLPNDSFDVARRKFVQSFPGYVPGGVIEKYLTSNWKKLDAF
ncbi:hypothetical protein [Aidingimonas lacisalsi]|uniref:hypothetical protein n=1 Tax=Aidingimonas lacisalsi TaxID=2604086 RepID=UPI0013756A27|nr:hypothetical protein [Aidingimonas lacisalsi]